MFDSHDTASYFHSSVPSASDHESAYASGRMDPSAWGTPDRITDPIELSAFPILT